MSATPPLADLAAQAPRGARRCYRAPARAGKTALLIHRLWRLREWEPHAWDTTLVWTRTTIAAEQFQRRLEDAAAERPRLAGGYRAVKITTPQRWAEAVHRRGEFGVPRREVWPAWMEREAIRAACLDHATRWPDGADRISADVPEYHDAIRQWAGTLALNGLDPAKIPDALDARNGDRAHRLAAVLAHVADRKRDVDALGQHDVFPALLSTTTHADVLAAFCREVRTLIIDDAQDLPLGAARLAARWAAESDGELWICLDPDTPTARFQGALLDEVLRVFDRHVSLTPEPLPAVTDAPPHARTLSVLRGKPAPPAEQHRDLSLQCQHVGDEVEEAYELARRIKHAVYASRDTETPLRYGDCGVVMQSLQPTGAYVADALTFYNIPFVRRGGPRLINAPLPRYLLTYLHSLDDETRETPPEALLVSGYAGRDLAPGAVRVLLHAWTTGAETPGPAGVDAGALGDWCERWTRLRDHWRRHQALEWILQSLAHEQILPLLSARTPPDSDNGAETEQHPEEFQHLTQLITFARRIATETNPLAAFERLLHAENAQAEWDDAALAADAVRLLTPYAARDCRFRWLAVAGFTAGRWPPPARGHVLRLDAATAAWLGGTPATLWAPDADAHDREWRRLAAGAIERCDGEVLLSVPRESAQGEPLDPSPWLDELGDSIATVQPLADPALPPALHVALTPAEAAAALKALPGESPAVNDARTLLNAPAPEPALSRDATPVDVSGRRVSATLLNTYLACPRRCFYLQFLRCEDRPPETEAQFAFGRAIHAVLEALHGPDGWPRWTADDAAAMEARAIEALRDTWAKEGLADLYANPLQAERRFARAREMLETYVRWAAATEAGVEVLRTEEHLSCSVGGAELSGVVDRLDRLPDGRLRIVDYKTGDIRAQAPSIAKEFLNLDAGAEWSPKNLQLLTYRLAIERALDLPSPIGETAFCGLKVDPGKAPRFPSLIWDDAPAPPKDKTRYTLTAAERDAATATFEATLAAVRAGRFPPEPADPNECRRCEARTMCPRVQVTDDDEAGEADDA